MVSNQPLVGQNVNLVSFYVNRDSLDMIIRSIMLLTLKHVGFLNEYIIIYKMCEER